MLGGLTLIDDWLENMLKGAIKIGDDDACWNEKKSLNVSIDGIGFSKTCDLVAYLHDRTFTPQSRFIRHLCGNKKCCNINHMEMRYRNMLSSAAVR